MKWEETEKAFYEGAPVIYRHWRDVYRFSNIHALRYTRNDIGGVDLTAELLDKSGNAVVRVRCEYLERDEGTSA